MLIIASTTTGYIVLESEGTKAASDRLISLGYQVHSTVNVESAKDQAPRSHVAYVKGNWLALSIW